MLIVGNFYSGQPSRMFANATGILVRLMSNVLLALVSEHGLCLVDG